MKPFARTLLGLLVMAATPSLHAGPVADHPGAWLGEMKIREGFSLKIGAELYTRADGSPWASMASPDQGAYDIPAVTVREAGDTIEIDLDGPSLKLTWRDGRFEGVFQEVGGPALSFPLTRVAAFPRKVKPQAAKAPFPYRDETLAIRSVDGVTLGATLSLPEGVDRPNAVVLAHGAGPQTRDSGGTFAVLSDALARQGIAVLRYDKRGIARSTGSYHEHTGDDLAHDLNAALTALRDRGGFARVGVVGHSEGSGIGAAVAARHPQSIDFLVSLAGVGLPGVDMLVLQDRVTAIANGATTDEAEQVVRFARSWYDAIVAQPDKAQRTETLKSLEAARSPEYIALADRLQMSYGSLSLANGFADKEFLRSALLADAPRDWRGVKCPVLALNGSLDRQVPPENLDGIAASLRAGGNHNVESAVLPSINHALQTAETGAESEYAQIEEIVAPVVLDRVARFVSRQE